MPTTRSQAGAADPGLQTSAQPAEPVTSPRASPLGGCSALDKVMLVLS